MKFEIENCGEECIFFKKAPNNETWCFIKYKKNDDMKLQYIWDNHSMNIFPIPENCPLISESILFHIGEKKHNVYNIVAKFPLVPKTSQQYWHKKAMSSEI